MIQRLAERRGVDIRRRAVGFDGRPASVSGEYRRGPETVQLLMPLTMMNESGQALRGLDVPLGALLIVCDDVNLPLGVLRLRPKGGGGGHHGLRSCLEALGTDDVARLRIGVGAEPLPRDLEEFVLSPFRSGERPVIRRAVELAADACEAWAADGLETAMNRYNRVQDT